MNKVIYGLHTCEGKKQITHREAKNIELLFGTSFPDEDHACSQFFKEGVSKFWIEEVTSKEYKKYFLHLRINMARASGVGNYCLMPYTLQNVKKSRKKISKVLKQLKLDDKNADLREWKIERLDTAFDVEVTQPEVYMKLLNKSLNVKAAKRQCKRILFTPANPNVCESIRFGNASYIYNVYIKLADLKNKGIAITPEILQEVMGIIRIERQNTSSALKNILKTGLFKDLELASVRDGILKELVDDIAAFWGKGDYYSSKQLNMEFNGISDIKQLMQAMIQFTKNSLESEYSIYTPEIKQLFQNYGIMPAGICKEDADKYQVYKMDGPYNMITSAYTIPDKRAYHVFPVPHPCSDGRYKAGITLHKVNDTRKQPVSVAKYTIKEYEEEVFKKLKDAYVTNVKYHCTINLIPELLNQSVDDILRFSQVVETKDVKEKVKNFIKSANLKSNKLTKGKG